MATRAGGQKRMRTFRPEGNASDAELARDVAKHAAVAWAAKDTDTDEEGDQDHVEAQ